MKSVYVRYAAIQLIAYGIDMALFLALLYTGLFNALLSNAISKIVAAIFSFVLHRIFTFYLTDDKKVSGQAVRYFLLLGINVPISSAVLSVVLLIDLPLIAKKFISDVIVVYFSFVLSKNWVFSSSTLNKNTPDSNRMGL